MSEPDFLGLDECDKAKDLSRSCAKRIGRFVDLVRDRCAVLNMSGTNKRKSIADDAHFMAWSLRERSPAPLTDSTLADFCAALDEESKVGAGRLRPGAVMLFAEQIGLTPANPDAPSMGELARAREGYRQRVEQTPGVIVHDVSECDQPITIQFLLPPHDPVIEAAFENFRTTYETPKDPNGQEGILLPDALSRFAHVQQLGWGGWYYYNPPPPVYWKVARKAWHTFVQREVDDTARSSKPLDTEMAVANDYPDHPALKEWRRVKKDFDPAANSTPGWLAASVVYAAAQFAGSWAQAGETGLIWVKHQAFAQALASVTGYPYFGAKGEQIDQYGRPMADATIENAIRAAHKAGKKPPIAILSVDANLRGRNLQAYHNNLIVGWEQAGTRTEQLIGRTHRSGQAREVMLTILVTCGETVDSFYSTMSEARFVKSQGLTQKILTARIDRSGLRAWPDGFRWVRKDT